ncbi:MAG: sigma-54 dependent transcriptional regulator [Geminicoccaceae bacterium]|nr:sigma-54 dependent transcriptional regulator [Geminicoccaceae bacterium]MCS7268208.1 sigma-54 dependent transcriptional regulator [Geminicoccaceae bacterium]MCX7631179.1 sigma-54 dependent transcriptional regulator [Geminicoccaceae bacterium]MDW8125022.1 sigma-54 dependent transcriptional regulator [Geminicoccaceae bacterium]MDW8341233.1 sigma-54 dependent transcriptional regulator [Geminicoccaceae bacterium]
MSKDILIVDDEAAIREVVSAVLEDEGFRPRQAATAEEALAQIQRRLPGLVLLDIWLEGSKMDGIQLLERIKAEHPHLPVVMFSGHGTIETAVQAIKKGAYDFIEKPFKADRLLLAVRHALEASRLKRENEELKARIGEELELVGSSPAMVKVRQTIEKVAPTNSRVLISGPAGSGKEVAARMIHLRSRRADGPFVIVNAAALSPDRVELELFGAEPGWLGPEQGRIIGAFERADGGTLLIDEVADMPLETQGKIIRVLHDQRFTRLGGDQRIEVDVRVLSTTNRDLKQEIAAGRFREDLYYRLNVVPLEMPRLADRRTDIPELARHFMQLAARNLGVPPRPISEEAMAVLQTANWPGDVRQLRNTVEWLLIMAPGPAERPIAVQDLPPELTASATSALDPLANGELVSMPLREAREHFERSYLQAQLQRFGGNISRTANFVGMERSALHRKLKTLGLNSSDD